MIFDVARALDFLGICRVALKLGEDRGERLAEEIRKHVESTAMRHADDQFLQAELAAALDDLLEGWDQRFRALDAKALGAGITLVEEALVSLGGGQPLEDGALALDREIGLVTRTLDAFLDPGLLGGILDMHVFDADMVAVGGAQNGEDLARRRRLEPEHVVDEDRPVEIRLGEAIRLRVELGVLLALLEAERVELRLEMTADAIRADQHQGAHRIERRLADLGDPLRQGSGWRGSDDLRRLTVLRTAIADHSCLARRPIRALQFGHNGWRLVVQFAKKTAPAVVHGGGFGKITRIELGDERAVRPVKK